MTGLGETYFGVLESDSIITDGLWHQVGLVYDFDALKRRLYVDGVRVAEDATFVAAQPSNGGLHIGTSKDLGVGTFLSGLIWPSKPGPLGLVRVLWLCLKSF